jgi:hypothetical protein
MKMKMKIKQLFCKHKVRKVVEINYNTETITTIVPNDYRFDCVDCGKIIINIRMFDKMIEAIRTNNKCLN